MPRVANARAVPALAVAVAVVGTSPRRNIAIRARPVLASAHAIDTSAVVAAHVRAHAFVMVDAAVIAREALGALANLVAEVAVAIVAAVVRADFYLAFDAAVPSAAVAFALVADTVIVAVLWTLSYATVRSGEAWHAYTCAVVTEAVDALVANSCRAVRSQPAGLAFAYSINAFPALAAVRWAILVRTLSTEEAGKAVAGAIVAVAVARAVGRTHKQRAIVALEPRVTLAQIVHASPVSIAVVGACANSARLPRKPLVAEACAVVACAVVGAVVRAHQQATVVARVTSFACTLKVWQTLAVSRAVVWAGANTAVWARVPCVAVARPVEALTMLGAVVEASLERAVEALPAVMARTVVVYASAVAVAVVGTSAHGAVCTAKTYLAVACPVVAVAVGGTVVGAAQETAVVASVPFIANATHFVANAVVRALVWTSGN